jgi:hypothetical protein
MIKKAIFFAALAVFFSCQSNEVSETKKQKVIVSALLVRESPNKDSKQIARLESGKVITTIARTASKDTIELNGGPSVSYWYKLSDNGHTGWVFGGCLSDKFPNGNRAKIDPGIIKTGLIVTCNDTLINCMVDQKDQETEIYVFNISFLDRETAIIHAFSSAGHTDETVEQVKYKIEDNLLKVFMPASYASRNTFDEVSPWKVKKKAPRVLEFEMETCNGKNTFKVVGDPFYCGETTALDMQESYRNIDSLINTAELKQLLGSIR